MTPRSHPSNWPNNRGFTIVEVMMASAVMVLAITTAILVLQVGLRAVDTARNMTLAGQIIAERDGGSAAAKLGANRRP
ncbi:MAG TPA: prepilin-type N-terminal cleavage/methylation domain-containing protein [Dehalococcoidia bacterium]